MTTLDLPDTAAVGDLGHLSDHNKIVTAITQVNGDLTAHTGDTTAVHGIADTAALATTADVAALGLVAPPLVGVVTAAQGTTPVAVDVWGGYTWGHYLTGIYRSADEGDSWTLYASISTGTIVRVLPTSDGEVLCFISAGVLKSSGWSGGSPTWTTKVTCNGAATILSWGVDGDEAGTKFITTEYAAGANFADSRYVRMSTDSGTTWSVVYDSVAVHGSTLANASHLHGCCYDQWGDRFYFTEGHGTIAGIYVSDDDGATWSRPAGMTLNPGPTTLTATAAGLVCGADSDPGGVYGVQRRTDPADEALVMVWKWNAGRAGVIGFGRRGYRQPGTGIVYLGFATSYADVAPIIVAATPTSGALVHTWVDPAPAAGDFIDQVLFTSANSLRAYVWSQSGDRTILTAHAGAPGVDLSATLRDANYMGGAAAILTSMALGYNSDTGTAANSVAAGVGAVVTGTQYAVAIGANASAVNNSVAIGAGATTRQPGNVVIGYGVNDNNAWQSVLIGENASGTASTVVIGRNTTAAEASIVIGTDGDALNNAVVVGRSGNAGYWGVALGRTANASGSESIAIGYLATASHAGAVALGKSAITTAAAQVHMGARHIEVTELSADPAAPAANNARLYTRDNGAGKTQLCVRFATGAVQVIATEP